MHTSLTLDTVVRWPQGRPRFSSCQQLQRWPQPSGAVALLRLLVDTVVLVVPLSIHTHTCLGEAPSAA